MADPRIPRDPMESATGARVDVTETTEEALSPYQRHARQRPRDPATGRLLPHSADPANVTEDDAPVELTPPKAMPNPRLTRPPPPPSDPGAMREMRDTERLEPGELSMRQQRARQLAAIANNPFIGNFDESGFPRVPENDQEWSYLWIRHTLPPTPGERSELDTKNIADKMTHGLLYELVRLQDLPEEWRSRMGIYRGKVSGIDGSGHIVFRDLMLARTSRQLRDMKQEANDHYARLQRQQVHDDLAGEAASRGFMARNQMNRREERFLSPEDQAATRQSFDEGVSDQIGKPLGGDY